MPVIRSFAPFLSISALLVLVGVIEVGTNVFLASWLPTAIAPGWTEQHPNETFLRVRIQPQESKKRNKMSLGGGDEEDTDMLHVVTTRFMQNQPNLVALGKARLLLFETFCLPSMLKQTMGNFLWFVMTDPNLDPILMDRLKDLLEPHDNFYLVLSVNKLVTPETLTNSTDTNAILTGDKHKLYSLMFDLNRPLLLETRLDADDGLHRATLGQIQEKARTLPNETEGWQVICNNIHFEWRNDDIMALNQTVESAGKLRLVMEGICVTPGYTLLKHRPAGSVDFPRWPKIGHHLITRDWPRCDSKNAPNATTNCWTKLERFPAALRSRTITSAGMNRIDAKPSENIYDNQTSIFWKYVEKDYGISPNRSLATSRYLQKHLPSIVEDNLKGQCTFGHSCKKSSKEKLYSLLNASISANNTRVV